MNLHDARAARSAHRSLPLLVLALLLGVFGMHALSTHGMGPGTAIDTVTTSMIAPDVHAGHDGSTPDEAGSSGGHHDGGALMVCGAMLLAALAAGLQRQPISRHVRRHVVRSRGARPRQALFARRPDPPSLTSLCLLRC